MPAKKKTILVDKNDVGETVLIDKYDYVEYADGYDPEDKVVLAIYGIDDDTLNKLYAGTIIKWDDGRQNNVDESEHGVGQRESLIWNGEVYAVFQDFVIVYLY
jgi:hypothetical protein